MRNLFDYINAGMQNSQCTSERKFCELLGKGPNLITTYRKGVLPTDETMMKLAKLANIPTWQALIDLNIWRAENDDIKKAYQDILKKVAKPALVFAMISTLIFGSVNPSHAANISPEPNADIYIITLLSRIRRAILLRIKTILTKKTYRLHFAT